MGVCGHARYSSLQCKGNLKTVHSLTTPEAFQNMKYLYYTAFKVHLRDRSEFHHPSLCTENLNLDNKMLISEALQ